MSYAPNPNWKIHCLQSSFAEVSSDAALLGRRSAPVPQLNCVGGSARGRFKPRAVQCVKQGFDGTDYQWKCSADMPQEYEFGQVCIIYLLVSQCLLRTVFFFFMEPLK